MINENYVAMVTIWGKQVLLKNGISSDFLHMLHHYRRLHHAGLKLNTSLLYPRKKKKKLFSLHRSCHSGSSCLAYWFGSGFTLDALPDAARPIYPDLGPVFRTSILSGWGNGGNLEFCTLLRSTLSNVGDWSAKLPAGGQPSLPATPQPYTVRWNTSYAERQTYV